MNPFKEIPYKRDMTSDEYKMRFEENAKIGASFYKAAFLPTILYALAFGILIYDNYTSITMTVYALLTIIYCTYMFSKTGLKFKIGNIFYMVVLLLLGISTFLTGNGTIHVFNYCAFLLMLVSLLVHQFYNDKGWGLGKYLAAVLFNIFGSASCWLRPFTEGSAYRKQQRAAGTGAEKKEVSSSTKYVVAGLMIAIPFVLAIGATLASADAVFKNFITSIGFNVKIGNLVGRLIFIFVSFILAYAGMRFVALEKFEDDIQPTKKSNPIMAMTFVTVLDILYVIFAIIQITCLFMGGTLPEGMTYAEYARTGFFQLLFVSILNLLIVLFIKAFAEDNAVLKILLLLFNICTYIVIASSAYRMMLYIEVYYLTFLRVFVLVALLLLATLFLGVTIYIFTDKFPMFKYGLICITVIYLAFSFARVDYWIADYNLARVDQAAFVDFSDPKTPVDMKRRLENDILYYGCLSTDAAPAIKKHEERLGDAGERISLLFTETHSQEFKRDDFWHYNKSVHDAKELFGE